MAKQVTAKLSATKVAVLALTAFVVAACGQQETSADEPVANAETANQEKDKTAEKMELITELQIIDVAPGEGAQAAAGNDVVVHYTGWLYDPSQPENKGTKFDSSVDRGQPFSFPLGAGRVIRGWDEGVAGMLVGGKRTLIIPPDMGYGSRGAGGVIPPDATLMFDVELLEIN
jgi:FKBP-type peptidyl-prolyl cis-trans isomerase